MPEFNPFSLEGKTILVTGASSGIGRSVAITISKMGGIVIANGRNREKLQLTISQMEGNSHQMISGDLLLQDDIEKIVESTPLLDGIVHCAGIGHRMPTKMITEEDVEMVMRTNFSGTVLLQAALLSKKKVKKSSSIVFITSKAADFPSIGNAIYSASKGALISYAKCLGLELAPRGIRVNCISPAMVWTDLIMQDEITIEELRDSEKDYPLKRYGKPEDIAYLAVYLLSDASSWMTNSCIDITGGGMKL
ncbi:MAG: SDR family oxidoreductase [Prevotella sp.]|nr:SDR family oxidoreductase [Prevotella sp.]